MTCTCGAIQLPPGPHEPWCGLPELDDPHMPGCIRPPHHPGTCIDSRDLTAARQQADGHEWATTL